MRHMAEDKIFYLMLGSNKYVALQTVKLAVDVEKIQENYILKSSCLDGHVSE